MAGISVIDERFLDAAEGRVAEWSVGGAMFGLTAAMVQLLIRSIVVRRNKVCCLYIKYVIQTN